MGTQIEIKKFKYLPENNLIDSPCKIPWIIKILENPKSPFALPGSITLYDHDCLHILLQRGVTPKDEAFIIGFTMGNDSKTNWLHLLIYKIFATFLYPKKYRFEREHWKSFDLGVFWGKKLKRKFSNINQVDFRAYKNYSVRELRDKFGISLGELKIIYRFEEWL